jgi:carbon storage regulator
MLVLTRKIGQELVIDGNIRLIVLSIKGDKIRVGIEAPPDVRVDRAEVHERRVRLAEPRSRSLQLV